MKPIHNPDTLQLISSSDAPTFENELVLPESALPQKYGDEVFESLSSGSYTPRLQLMTGNSKPVKAGEFPTNHYAIIADGDFQDVGKDVDVYAIQWRPKALDTSDGVVTIFDPESEEFKRMQAQSEVKDSGCMWGYDFLVYVPSVGKFATFFLGTKSSRRVSKGLKALLGKSATLTSHFIETKDFSWQAPKIVACSTPLTPPDPDELIKEIDRFNNPPKDERELVKDDATSSRET